MTKIYTGIVRDHSGSMRHLVNAALKDYNTDLQNTKDAAASTGIQTVLSIIECGINGLNVRKETLVDVSKVKPLTTYVHSGMTPLFDAIGDLITQFETLPDANDPDVQFMIRVTTDGEENGSHDWLRHDKLKLKIRELQSKDNWTFVFRVPNGYRRTIISKLDLYEGNVVEWETTTRGLETASIVQTRAVQEYYTASTLGVKKSEKFYTDLSNVTAAQVSSSMEDISGQVNIFYVNNDSDIRPFLETNSGLPYVKGTAYYQLTKTESAVQDYKVIAIRDKKTLHVYSGAAARDLLGLPKFGNVKLVPGDHGNFDIFIQSTSVNRNLKAGTLVLHWPTRGVAYAGKGKVGHTVLQSVQTLTHKKAPTYPTTPAPKLVPVAPKKAATLSSTAYAEGFKAGKNKKKNEFLSYPDVNDQVEYSNGFSAGKKSRTS